ncbi:MAG: DUF4432 family protein [Herbiconiux sp.]|uniref:DUF4432 family protein n=1 Tax=Herbiconiux sp. TaxID=1871186 RepID=UPI001215713D|nr:DUF4432 family protein [Herbiconiux sp.]TAJ49352.1 MAG: DUF4432 family protein [Herbiconiux sp.]
MNDSRRDIEARIGAVERAWGPRTVQASNGPEAGRRQIDLRGLGGLSVTVEPDQFLDLGLALWNGDAVSVTTPSTSARAESWGRRWLGGLLTTCGLTAVGRASVEEGGMHGRAHLVSATVTRAEGRWNGDAYALEVAGSMREGAIFEQNLTVDRTITAEHGESRISISDVVRNEGFDTVPVKLLYHINLGWPLLDAGAHVEAAAKPAAGDSSEALWRRDLGAPEPQKPEKVDALVAVAGDDGWSVAELLAETTVVTVRYRTEELPFLTVWRSEAAGSYALGIEPGTCWPSHADGPQEGKTGRLLAPGESLTTALEITFSAR